MRRADIERAINQGEHLAYNFTISSGTLGDSFGMRRVEPLTVGHKHGQTNTGVQVRILTQDGLPTDTTHIVRSRDLLGTWEQHMELVKRRQRSKAASEALAEERRQRYRSAMNRLSHSLPDRVDGLPAYLMDERSGRLTLTLEGLERLVKVLDR